MASRVSRAGPSRAMIASAASNTALRDRSERAALSMAVLAGLSGKLTGRQKTIQSDCFSPGGARCADSAQAAMGSAGQSGDDSEEKRTRHAAWVVNDEKLIFKHYKFPSLDRRTHIHSNSASSNDTPEDVNSARV